ncbi:MAG: hypothetical protein LBD33_00195, partial [Puniceicoccales bacterium]|nr:hypothetical protein [Puniceicoccales bacterium]
MGGATILGGSEHADIRAQNEARPLAERDAAATNGPAAAPERADQAAADSNLLKQINAMAALQRSAGKIPGDDWPPELLEAAKKIPGAKVIRTASADGSGGLLSRRPGFLKSTPFGGSQAIVYKGVTFIIQNVNGKRMVVAHGKGDVSPRQITHEFLQKLQNTQSRVAAGTAGANDFTIRDSVVTVGGIELEFPAPRAEISLTKSENSCLAFSPERLKDSNSQEAKLADEIRSLAGTNPAFAELQKQIGSESSSSSMPPGEYARQLQNIAGLFHSPVQASPHVPDTDRFLSAMNGAAPTTRFNNARKQLDGLLGGGTDKCDRADILLRAINVSGPKAEPDAIIRMYKTLGGTLPEYITEGEIGKFVAMGKDAVAIANGRDASKSEFQNAMARLTSEQEGKPVAL